MSALILRGHELMELKNTRGAIASYRDAMGILFDCIYILKAVTFHKNAIPFFKSFLLKSELLWGLDIRVVLIH